MNNPATNEVLCELPSFGKEETNLAIEKAQEAFKKWRRVPAKDRAAVLYKWYQLLIENAEQIGKIMCLESGKPLAESIGEVYYGASGVDWFSAQCQRIDGDVLQPLKPDQRFLTFKEPVGVCAAITPWNFPLSMITRKVAPAIAAGCSIVLKPADLTPVTAIALAELACRAGIPPGVFSVVFGEASEIGNTMTDSDIVRKITFTGSTRVGQILLGNSAKTIKKASMELGGNAPFIVFDDANLDAAAQGIVGSALRNAGQTCICANRVFVQDGVYDALAEKVTNVVKSLKVGNGIEKDTKIGPLISPGAVDKVKSHVDDAVKLGAEVLTGGKIPELPSPLYSDSFYLPTVLKNMDKKMLVFREETFGPLVPLFKFSTVQQAVELANDTEFGLAAYFYTNDIQRAFRVAEELEYGIIGVNDIAVTSSHAPFGGIKHSGIGREHSKYGIDEYLYIKTVAIGFGKSADL